MKAAGLKACAVRRRLPRCEALQTARGKPVVVANAMTPLESQVVGELMSEGIRFQHRLDDAAIAMTALHDHAKMHVPA